MIQKSARILRSLLLRETSYSSCFVIFYNLTTLLCCLHVQGRCISNIRTLMSMKIQLLHHVERSCRFLHVLQVAVWCIWIWPRRTCEVAWEDATTDSFHSLEIRAKTLDVYEGQSCRPSGQEQRLNRNSKEGLANISMLSGFLHSSALSRAVRSDFK